MIREATKEFLDGIEALTSKRIKEIRETSDTVSIIGAVYYVSETGDDNNDGKSPLSPWKSLEKVSCAALQVGDGVRFRRGDTFRGFLVCKPGVTYCAYGEGEKPKFYGWDKSLADEALWTIFNKERNIWKLREPILDCGTLVFNDGEAHCRKLIPSYINSRFVCRDDENKTFDMESEMTDDLDLFCSFDARVTENPSKGQSFPVPLLDDFSFGELYLRCDRGNPAKVFKTIEAVPRRSMIRVGSNENITVDNLCLKYIGCHAVAAGGHVKGLHVTNCEIGWIGGAIQHYFGTDPNYPQGGRGTVTRFGNGVEIYGGCEDYIVSNCYIYQVYDAGMTHQVTTNGNTYKMTKIRYLNNVVENCVYSIEYFLEKTMGDTESFIDDCIISGNILRFAGYGWGQQRHNSHTPAHIKGWSYENTASNYTIKNNIFDRSAYRMLHLVAKKAESCPKLDGNTYIQKYGMTLGQYGPNEHSEPEIIGFFDNAEEKITSVMGDKNAKIYYLR